MSTPIYPNRRNIVTQQQGEDVEYVLVDRDPDTGDIIDTAGSVYFMYVAKLPAQGVVINRLGVLDSPTTSGTIRFQFVQQDTLNLVPGIYKFDVWRQKPNGDRIQVVKNSDFKLGDPVADPLEPPTSPDPVPIVGYGLPDPLVATVPSLLQNNPAGTLTWAPGVPVPNPALIPDNQVLKTTGGVAVWGTETDPEVPTPVGQPDGKFLKTLSNALVYGDETDPEIPSPSAEPDNKVLKTLGGVAVWGQAIPPSSTVGYLLTTQPAGTLVWSPLTTSARLTFTAGITGLADQVAIVNPAIFGFRITNVQFHCDAGIVGATVALQSGATVPGLVDITERFDFSAFFDGWVDETVPSFTRTVPNTQLLYLHRSDDRVAGSVIVTIEVI